MNEYLKKQKVAKVARKAKVVKNQKQSPTEPVITREQKIEEGLVDNFLREVAKLAEGEIPEKIDSFINYSELVPETRWIFVRLLLKLPLVHIQVFAKEYRKQKKLSSLKFLEDYIAKNSEYFATNVEDDDNSTMIDMSNKEDVAFFENKKNEEKNEDSEEDDMEDNSDDEEVYIEEDPMVDDTDVESNEKWGGTAEDILINKSVGGSDYDYDKFNNLLKSGLTKEELEAVFSKPQISIVEPDMFTRNTKKKYNFGDTAVDSELYHRSPWLNARVNGVYLYSFDDISDYILPDIVMGKKTNSTWEQLSENGEVERVWNKANNKFFALLNDTSSMNKIQEGDILSVLNNGKRLRFMVGFDTNQGFKIQNEEIYEAEKKYKLYKNKSVYSKIQETKKDPISNDILLSAKNKLVSTLDNIAPNVKYYNKDSNFINSVISLLKDRSSNIGEFANMLGNIIIYITPGSQFAKQIINEEYIPPILVHLSQADKFPEIFNSNSNLRVIQTNQKILELKLEKFVEEFIEDNLKLGERNRTKDAEGMHNDNLIIDQSLDMSIIPNKNVIYYTDGDKKYSIIISTLINRFNDDDYTIPGTDIEMSAEFIEKFKKENDIVAIEKTVPVPPNPDLPDLVALLIREISSLKHGDDTSDEDSDNDSDNESVHSIFKPPNDSPVPDSPVPDSPVPDSPISASSIHGGSINSEQSIDEDSLPVEYTKCHYCSSSVDNTNCLRTIVANKDDSGTFRAFCAFPKTCFMNHSKWPNKKRRPNA